jgi:hypothetical protein
MSVSELALFAFTACNTLRVVAYLPQILKIARDSGGASAISYSTWALFGASHVSTVAYAVATLHDWRLAFIFTANAAACGAIVALTLYKRLRFASQARTISEPDLHGDKAAGPLSSVLCPPPSDRVRNLTNIAILRAERRRIAGESS